MSFNPNDNNPLMISRDNYEEYFLMYVDNELTEAETKAVELFLQAHPDLQAELEILMTTKLPAEDIFLKDKEALLADSMKLNAIDESLLLYIDDELKGKEKKDVEQKIEKDKDYQLQHNLLLKTKLDKAEKLIYPYKKELYRKEEEKKRPVYWMRAAAAIIIVLGIGAAIWSTNGGNSGQVEIAQGPGTVKQKNNTDQKTAPAEQPASQENLASTGVKDKAIKSEQHNVRHHEFIVASKGVEKEKKSNIDIEEKKKEIVETPQVANNNIAIKDPVQKDEDLIAKIIPSENASKQSINKGDVTPKSSDPYYKQQTESGTAKPEFAAITDNEKKSSLKGLLRKATRFIERRTNIKATNEDDELLIGAVAIQL